jgi:hypothetical protein
LVFVSIQQLITSYEHNTIALDFVPKGHSFPNKLKLIPLKNQIDESYTEKPFVYLSYYQMTPIRSEVLDLHAGKTTF